MQHVEDMLTNQNTFFNTLSATYSLLWQQKGHLLKLMAGQCFTFLVRYLFPANTICS